MEYEFLFFTSVANEDRIGTIKKELTEILTGLGARINGDFSDIGKRKLAYPIKRNTHAFFSFVRFELDDEGRQNIPEMGKRISLYDKVMRHLIVRADEIGKTVGVLDIKPIEIVKERPKEKVPVQPIEIKLETVETKPKASLAELDKKLSEILDETPE